MNFYLINNDSHEITMKLLFKEPWMINDMVLQLVPW